MVTTPCSLKNMNQFQNPYRKKFWQENQINNYLKQIKLANILDLQYNQG